MSSIVQYNDWLEEETGNMAREGLRTLVVAKKTITTDQYRDFEVGDVFQLVIPVHSFNSNFSPVYKRVACQTMHWA